MSKVNFFRFYGTLFLGLFVFIGCGEITEKIRKEARKELVQLGIEYSGEEFLNTIRNHDVVAVKLFIKAGMNPNIKK